MKLIFTNQEEETITIDRVDPTEHIIVALRNGEPFIVTRLGYELGNFKAICLSDEFLNGNGYSEKPTLEQVLDSDKFEEIQVFENKDWRKALQWLIDNA